MNEQNRVARVLLNRNAKTSTNKMMELLKTENKFIKVNPSKLVSWIVNRYFQNYFIKDKKLVVDAHFNSKEYLLSVIKDSNNESDLKQVMKTLERVKGNKK